MKLASIAFGGILCFAMMATATTTTESKTFAPENDLDRYDNIGRNANMTEEEFNKIIDAVTAIWAPIVQKHNAQLVVTKNWKSSTVNASAQQSSDGKKWMLNMYGGLARRPEVTPDGFAMVVCHELGHHFAGYFFYKSKDGKWASSEGQSDYFATHTCAQAIFAMYAPSNTKYREDVPVYVKERCDAMWKTAATQDRCYRTSAAGLSLASLLAAIGNQKAPTFETPDTTKVTASKDAHPKAQCRLDTYFAGALCNAPFDIMVIPGKGTPGGNNSKDAEIAASKLSCTTAGGYTLGVRPACWFKSLLTN